MARNKIEDSSTTAGLPLSPSMEPALLTADVGKHSFLIGKRVMMISLICVGLAMIASLIAVILIHLIGLITNLSFFGRFSTEFTSPANNQLGLWVILIPVIGSIIVGIMARYGSKAIRGHGIPEAMEQILTNRSIIPVRITFLKPISAAIAIGTGGPFGAEGPIIATGGALGSVLGQLLKTTAMERKTLLAAGAAAGMTATFGSPISSVILAIELLLFEFKPQSFIPVCLAATTAAATRFWLVGSEPVFKMPPLTQPSELAILFYVLEGVLIGGLSVLITKAVYWIEDHFDKLPVHWMWWPALGGLVVGIVGYFSPHTLGVGYDNIDHILSGNFLGTGLVTFILLKFISWSVSLSSGTSGGTLAPLFTIGGGAGAVIGFAFLSVFPHFGIDVKIAALVGMAATFAGASRALLASVVFAFETTQQPCGLLPLLGGCSASFLVSAMWMKQTIMTEKIARRGLQVPMEYIADPLMQLLVSDYSTKNVISLHEDDQIGKVRELISGENPDYQHQGFPVVSSDGKLKGVLTRRDLLNQSNKPNLIISKLIQRPPVVIYGGHTLREAVNLMIQKRVGRLPVVLQEEPMKITGILTRQDILYAQEKILNEHRYAEVTLPLFGGLTKEIKQKNNAALISTKS